MNTASIFALGALVQAGLLEGNCPPPRAPAITGTMFERDEFRERFAVWGAELGKGHTYLYRFNMVGALPTHSMIWRFAAKHLLHTLQSTSVV